MISCLGTPIHAEQDVQMLCSTWMCENDPAWLAEPLK
jgi:hypothetical protein